MAILQKILFLVIGLMTGKPIGQADNGASAAAGAFNSLAFYSAAIGGVAWVFGPGREWHVTFNALELSAVGLAAAILGALFLHLKPPGPG